MSMTEDLTPFFNTAEFADAATLGGVAVVGIFDNGHALGSVGMAGVASVQPVLTLPSASVPAIPVGASVVVGGVNYLVAEHEPDGTGISRLILERVL